MQPGKSLQTQLWDAASPATGFIDKRDSLVWAFTDPTASSHYWVEDGPSSNVIRNEKVVQGLGGTLVYTAL